MIIDVIHNPLYLSTIIVPLINLPIIYYYDKYNLLISGILLTITSILYHYDFKIKYIRSIDICMTAINYLQHLYISIIYKDTNYCILIYIIIFMLYVIDKKFESNGYLIISNYIHSLMHFMLIYGVIHLIF